MLPSVTQIKFMQSGRNILVGTDEGEIYLLYIPTWSPLVVDKKLVFELNGSISSLQISPFEPFYVWLAGTSKGKCNVYMRKNVSKGNDYYIEDALKNIRCMEYYQVDGYKV